MAAYELLLQIPEVPIKEEWRWLTDVIVSNDGSEDSIPLNRYPKRTFSGTYQFDTVKDIRYHMAAMFNRFGHTFRIGLFQYQVKLKAPVAAFDNIAFVNTARGDFRAGGLVLFREDDKHELMLVDSISYDSLLFTTAFVNDYSERAIVCPVTEAYSPNGSAFTRRNPDGTANASFTYNEVEAEGPFVAPENTETVTTFDGFPLLDRRAIGNQFDMSLDTGISINEYIGRPDVFTDWNQSQWAFPLRWQCNRVFDNNDWLWWMVFVDYLQGSSETFLLPTFRSDMTNIMPVGTDNNNQILVAGTEYFDHYYPYDTFKRIVIDSNGGRHYAKVTLAEVLENGTTRLTFTPPHPDSSPWYQINEVGMLMKVRIADDKVTCDHYGLHTDITISVRTVP
jgi:hypothetical protein